MRCSHNTTNNTPINIPLGQICDGARSIGAGFSIALVVWIFCHFLLKAEKHQLGLFFRVTKLGKLCAHVVVCRHRLSVANEA